jgi:hypothetical protein
LIKGFLAVINRLANAPCAFESASRSCGIPALTNPTNKHFDLALRPPRKAQERQLKSALRLETLRLQTRVCRLRVHGSLLESPILSISNWFFFQILILTRVLVFLPRQTAELKPLPGIFPDQSRH